MKNHLIRVILNQYSSNRLNLINTIHHSVPRHPSRNMDILAVAEIAVLLWLRQRRRRRRRRQRIWAHAINTRRPEFGSFAHLFPDLINNPEKFYDFFRITTEQFKMLVELIGSSIRKKNTNYRLAVRPEERLAVFLR